MQIGKSAAWRVVLVVLFTLIASAGAMAESAITIGATLGITGPGSIAKESVPLDAALRDCIAIANEQGGIHGKKVNYVMEDDQYKPEVGLQVFENLMVNHKPLAVFGSGTPVALAVQSLLKDRYKVLYTSTSFSAKLLFRGNTSTFLPGPSYGDQVAVALKYIAQKKRDARVAFFYSKGPLGEDPVPYGRIVCRNLRLALVDEVVGEIKGGDHAPQIEQLKKSNPDYVILHGWVGSPNAALIKQCRDLGLKSEIVTTIWGAQKSVIDALGTDGPSFLAVSPYAYWWMDDVPMIKVIKEYTNKHYPEVKERTLPYMVAFTSAKIFLECLTKADTAGQLNGDGLVRALQSLKDFDTGGLTPPLTIRENKFPVARVLRSIPAAGTFVAETDWIKFY